MTPETLEQIETKIAFLERANAELSDVVYRQKKEIDELRARLSASPRGSMRHRRRAHRTRSKRKSRLTIEAAVAGRNCRGVGRGLQLLCIFLTRACICHA